eukprot:TRINITY_DN31491_c0_g1_i1.p1 TRINITY_DN31491_c0_g1~~TRINITY_DN31491_c0_g1_i1.p1  ORF type:complete len:290 (-),score=38.63 TRINITY_DN31491_c0_g1_i1:23-892(-)
MIRRPPRSTQGVSSAASDVYKRQVHGVLREPYTYSPDICSHIRNTINLRYEILPYIYTEFYRNCVVRGWPLLMPLWMQFKKDLLLSFIEDQFMLGSAFLVKPICESEKKSVKVYLPKGCIWYDYFSKKCETGHQWIDYKADDLGIFPLFIRGGSIIPLHSFDYVRSSEDCRNSPFSLLLALNEKQEAQGTLFLDDGKTFNYSTLQKYSAVSFEFKEHSLRSKIHSTNFFTSQTITKIKIIGYPATFASIAIHTPKGTQLLTVFEKIPSQNEVNITCSIDPLQPFEINFT